MSKLMVERNISGIDGLCLIIPKLFQDNRGYFKEVFNNKEYIEQGFGSVFVQDNEAFSKKNVLRGFHVNIKRPQAKLIRVIYGEIYDVVIDLRKGSATFKKWFGVNLSAENHRELYIPEGFGHAYLALTDSVVNFKVTTHYIAGDEIGFAWNSREFGIDWPIVDPILNESDKNSLDFAEIEI